MDNSHFFQHHCHPEIVFGIVTVNTLNTFLIISVQLCKELASFITNLIQTLDQSESYIAMWNDRESHEKSFAFCSSYPKWTANVCVDSVLKRAIRQMFLQGFLGPFDWIQVSHKGVVCPSVCLIPNFALFIIS